MTDFTLLKEFLESGLTQKAFAESKGRDTQWISKLLWKQMMNLYKNGIITPGPYAYEVRYSKKHKDQILKAINYDQTRNNQNN